MNILLCGMPASGKTTVGKLLADQIEREFIDLDQLISKSHAFHSGKIMTCKEIVMEEGEPYFRKLEKGQISALVDVKKAVIALGGGSLCDHDNLRVIKSLGYLIYIRIPVDVLWERIKKRGMLSYLDKHNPEQSFYEIAKSREGLYKSAADITIDAGERSEKEIVDKLYNAFLM